MTGCFLCHLVQHVLLIPQKHVSSYTVYFIIYGSLKISLINDKYNVVVSHIRQYLGGYDRAAATDIHK